MKERELRMVFMLVASLLCGYEYGMLPGITAFLFGLALVR